MQKVEAYIPPAQEPTQEKSHRPSPLIAIGNFLFRYRNMVFPVVLIGMAILSRPRPFLGNVNWDPLEDALGIGLALTGQILRVIVIGLAYIKRGGKKKKIYADDLVQEGIFAHCRNPLYVGNILILSGLLLVHNGPLSVWLGLPLVFFTYWTIVLAEEQYLRNKFGPAYEEYCRSVPRFGFHLKGLATTFRGSRFDWKKVLNKEYSTPLAWISAVIALLIWQSLLRAGLEATKPMIYSLAAFWAILVVAWFAAFIAKKSGRLDLE